MQRQLLRGDCNLMRQRGFFQERSGVRYPFLKFAVQANLAFSIQCQGFPSADRRKPEFVGGIAQFLSDAPPEPRGIQQTPQPDVGVQQKLQSRNTSQSDSSLAGDTMSPRISILPFIDPIQSRGRTGATGTTSATGFPKRVIRIGFLVFWTCSRSERHFALNSEIAICFMTT